MPRKQVGAIDAELLAEVDKRAEWLGQTRRVFIERTLQERVSRADWKITGGQALLDKTGGNLSAFVPDDWDAEQALSEAKEPGDPEQADSGSVSSSEGVRSAAPAEQPCEWCGHVEDEFDHKPCREALEWEEQGRRAVPYRQHVPGPNVEGVRSSVQAKRDVRPVPKAGEK